MVVSACALVHSHFNHIGQLYENQHHASTEEKILDSFESVSIFASLQFNLIEM